MLAESELWPVSLNLIRPLSVTPRFQLQRRHYPGAVSPPPLSSCQALSTVFMCIRAFSDGSAGKETACNAGDVSLIPGSGRSPGGGHGNPRQYSCLKNPMDWEAWQTTVQGVAKSQTWLSTGTFRCISWSDTQQFREEVLLLSQSPFHMKKQESIRLWPPLTKSICQANNRGRWGGGILVTGTFLPSPGVAAGCQGHRVGGTGKTSLYWSRWLPLTSDLLLARNSWMLLLTT